MNPVDLRSDTVTRPTPGMRRAIADAEVGDDVFGDDLTVQALERRVADLAGKEAGLFVPSGTMGNQLAIHALTAPGEQLVLDSLSHIFLYEQAGVAANAGLLAHTVRSERTGMTPAQIDEAFEEDPEDDHVSRTTLVCVENTHNRHGGAIVSLESLKALATHARDRGARVHMDGARLWNASVATGIPIAEWAACADTVMMCFSKGLGAPIGSILVGPRDVIRLARRVRKRWGGGMRQVGILAAACLHVLDHHVTRLADDHARAKRLAAGLQIPGVSVVPPDTNIVYATLEHPALTPPAVQAAMAERGVWISEYGRQELRAIVHLDIDDAGLERAIAAFVEVVEEQTSSAAH